MSTTQGPICHDYGIRGYGDPTHKVMLVGIAPSQDEVSRTKKPFTGPPGQLLDALLKFAGWSKDKVYATNAICYYHASPDTDLIEQCGTRLRHEISMYKPKLIITAGTVASEAILGVKRRKGQRGAVLWSNQWKCYVLDTHHPAYALHSKTGGMSAVQDILRDLSKIKRVLAWEPGGAANADVFYDTVSSVEHAQEILNNLPKNTRVALDIETSNPDVEFIDSFRDSLLCLSIAYKNPVKEQVWVFPAKIFPACIRSGAHMTAILGGGTCPVPECPIDRSSGFLTLPEGIRWTFQGGQFDVPGLYRTLGLNFTLSDDTMLMSHCTDERPGYHGLKANAREWLGAGFYEEEVKPFYKGKMHLLEDSKIESYNAKDAAYTLRLADIYTERMEADDTRRLYENILLPAMQTFIPQQIRGIRVDQDRLKELAYDNWFPKYLDMFKSLQEEAQQIGWPTDDINFNSNLQMGNLFFKILNMPVTKLTKAGKPSIDKEVLDAMDHPFAAKLREFRLLDGMIDRVFELWANMAPDGRIHPMPYVTNTRTGRTAYQRPAAQTWPKDYTVGADYARIREVLIPIYPNTHMFLEFDYNQIEVWLAQHETGDVTLLEHLRSGDVHSATAEGAFSTKRILHTEPNWQVLRQNAKKIRFGLQYGESAKGLSRPRPVGIGGTQAEANKYIRQFWGTYPQHAAWIKNIQQQAVKKGYLRTPTGRVMRFPLVFDNRELRQAINFPVQINASDYCLTSMIELDHPDHSLLKQYNSWVVLNWHDCLVVECDKRYTAQVAALIREIMQKPRITGYPSIHVDAKIGDNLGAMAKCDY